MTDWWTGLLMDGEEVVRSGANQTGRYIIIRTRRGHLWRRWDRSGKQAYVRQEADS